MDLLDNLGRRRLRLASGAVLFIYLTAHLVNHALGLVSLEVAEAGLRIAVAVWHSVPGTVLLYGAAAVHVALALHAIFERRTLRMPGVQALRIALGLWMPVVLITHFTGSRIAFERYDLPADYARIVAALWTPEGQGRQLALLAPGWIHGCLGLRFAFGARPWWRRAGPVLFGASLLLPVLAGLGFLVMGRELAQVHAAVAAGAPAAHADDHWLDLVAVRDRLLAGYFGAIALVLAARQVRLFVEQRRRALVGIAYPGRRVQVPRGWSVLEASRSFGIAHLSLCGGQARCSTCRVRIVAGADRCPPPAQAEQTLLSRMRAGSDVRLACQLRPDGDIGVVPLLAASSSPLGQAEAQPTAERRVAIVVAELRRARRSASAHRSAHDSAYVLALFHEAFGAAVVAAGGTPCGGAGRRAMAVFGLAGELPAACRQALAALADIERGVRQLNERLTTELSAQGELTLAAHAGPVVMAPMGHGEPKTLTAVGPAVDVTEHLRDEAQRQGWDCAISQVVLVAAGVTDAAGLSGADGPTGAAGVADATGRLTYTVPDEDGRPLRALLGRSPADCGAELAAGAPGEASGGRPVGAARPPA